MFIINARSPNREQVVDSAAGGGQCYSKLLSAFHTNERVGWQVCSAETLSETWMSLVVVTVTTQKSERVMTNGRNPNHVNQGDAYLHHDSRLTALWKNSKAE